jgi:polyribonucleotide nucleotidyltransferase
MEAAEGQDFFPLMVDYKEKFYAAGKFLGGFMKREGRPSNQEILLMRMIDRPFRPLFPEGYLNETIVMAQVVSFDENYDPEILAGLGAAASLAVSDIPFAGPVGFCKLGLVNGEFIIDPSNKQLENSELDMIIAASPSAILMVEGECAELSEEKMLEAINVAHDHIKKVCGSIQELADKAGKPKREFVSVASDSALVEKVRAEFESKARACLDVVDKLDRQKTIKALEKDVAAYMEQNFASLGLEEGSSFGKKAYSVVDEIMYQIMRSDILDKDLRIGKRRLDEVRHIETETNILKKVHGSSLFTRGETQVMSTVTLGGKDGEQMVDNIHGLSYSKFYLHYTFAPFCVGEARGYRGVGRREVGHGNLAERALKRVIPADYPYTIRLCCEVLESNGSSSMGSVCAGSMALMDTGVPITSPVAGVAMGLVKDGENYKILTDILGDEDHLGDMDFKVAGTKQGITAIQMDIKIDGITTEIFEKAMAQAKDGRFHILDKMNETITTNRTGLKDMVPKIESMKIEPDKIGALIGPSGKNIKKLQEEFQVNIEIDEDGTVKIIGTNGELINNAKSTIALQINGPKVGDVYSATVVSIKEYGAFVDIAPGVSGIDHVSEMAAERVKEVRDYVSEGQKIQIKILDVDRFGKIKMSAKEVSPLEKLATAAN